MALYIGSRTQLAAWWGAWLAAALISCKPILIKALYAEGLEVLPLMAWRFGLALPVYLLVGYWAWSRQRTSVSRGMLGRASLAGVLGFYLASYLDLSGLQYISAQLERVLLYIYPSFVLLLGALFFAIPFKRRMLWPLLLTYLGVVFAYCHDLEWTHQRDVGLGSGLVLASALAFAWYMLFSRGLIVQLGSALFTCIAMSAASLAVLLHLSLAAVELPELTLRQWGLVLALVMFATVLPAFLVSWVVKHLGAARASISGMLGPVMTSILAVLWLDERFSYWMLVGLALVLTGMAWLQRERAQS